MGERQSEDGSLDRFDGDAAWKRLPPDVQAAIGATALEIAVNFHLMDRIEQDELPSEFYGRIAEAAAAELHRDLMAEALDALPEGALEGADGRKPRVPSRLGRICRVCACSQNDACAGGCSWAADDLCSECVDR